MPSGIIYETDGASKIGLHCQTTTRMKIWFLASRTPHIFMHDDEFIKNYIKPTVELLYERDRLLFEHDLSERSIAFRFAHYLQNRFDELGKYDVFVDCDYNSHIRFEDGEWRRCHGKPLEDRDGSGATGRFIDLIVHRRVGNESSENWSDLICFEIKKWNNQTDHRNDKDRNNLERLTVDFGYKFGFHLIFGKAKEDVQVEVFNRGQSCGALVNLFTQ